MRGLQGLFIRRRFHIVFALVLDGAGQKTAGAAGRIEHGFVQFGIDPIDDKLGDGAGGVELPGIAGALQVFKNLFVNGAEGMAVFLGVEVDLADLVDHLAHQGAGFHVVVGVFKNVLHHQRPFAARPQGVEFVFQGREELEVDKIGQLVTGHAFRVFSPGPPAEMVRQRGFIVIFQKFQLGFAVIKDFQKKHPDQLADALGVAIDTDILAHDVLDGFDDA